MFAQAESLAEQPEHTILCLGTGSQFISVTASYGGRMAAARVDSATIHSGESLRTALEHLAATLGAPSPRTLLASTSHCRVATTLARDVVLGRRGDLVGVLASPGLVGDAARALASAHLASELVEVVDSPFQPSQVRAAVRRLCGRGVRFVVAAVSGRGSQDAAVPDENGERQLQKWIATDYPAHSLGALPVLAASAYPCDQGWGERLRAAVLDGYLRRSLVRHLFNLEGQLGTLGIRRPLLVVCQGGEPVHYPWASAGRISSGAVAVQAAAARWHAHYGLTGGAVLCVSGAATEIGRVTDAGEYWVVAGGLSSPVRLQSGLLRTLAGPVPDSTSDPTLGDALRVLGWVFDGSACDMMIRSREAALEALAPLGRRMGVEPASIAQRVLSDLAAAVAATLKPWDSQPQALLACGSGGGLLACQVAVALGVDRIFVLRAGGTIHAFGAGCVGSPLLSLDPVLAACSPAAAVPANGSTTRVALSAADTWADVPVLPWSGSPSRRVGVGPVLLAGDWGVTWVAQGWRYRELDDGNLELVRAGAAV